MYIMKNINDPNFGDLNFNLDFGNFNPDEIDTDETINAVFVIDTSYSINSYVHELNSAFNEFVETMQKSHVADRLFVSIVEFNEKVTVKNGFQPITTIAPMDFSKSIGGVTSLYDATFVGVKNAMDYRENLENSGVETKTLVFVITDGDDNNSNKSPQAVKKLLGTINSDEHNAFSFSSVLFGVGRSANFKLARKEMGIEHLAEVGTTGAEIKKMIGFISQSISSVSNGQAAPSPNF